MRIARSSPRKSATGGQRIVSGLSTTSVPVKLTELVGLPPTHRPLNITRSVVLKLIPAATGPARFYRTVPEPGPPPPLWLPAAGCGVAFFVKVEA